MKPEPPVTRTALIAASRSVHMPMWLERYRSIAQNEKAATRRPFQFANSLEGLFRRRQGSRFGCGCRRFCGRLFLTLGQDELVALDRNFAQPVHHRAGTG